MLALFLKDPAWVRAARENIGPEDFSEGVLRQVVDVIWSLAGETNDWSTNDLLVRLNDESAQSLVTRLISVEEGKLGDRPWFFRIASGRSEKKNKRRPEAD